MTASIKPCLRCGKKRSAQLSRGTVHCRDCYQVPKHAASRWMEHGACRDIQNDPDWWWPSNINDPNIADALKICGRCPVRDLCLTYAIQHGEREGIWGGHMPADRARMAALQRKKAV